MTIIIPTDKTYFKKNNYYNSEIFHAIKIFREMLQDFKFHEIFKPYTIYVTINDNCCSGISKLLYSRAT